MASVTVVGNLTDDPELRFTQNGSPMARFTIAENHRYRDRSGNWQDGETTFVRCVAWQDLGENIAESLKKGDRIVVLGDLRSRSWETEDGQRRTMLEVNVRNAGPSLQWATASPTKTSRRGGSVSRPAQSAAPDGDFSPTSTAPDEAPF